MSQVSEISIKRFKGETSYSNYKFVERITHCVFDIVYGTDTEKYFFLKYIGVNLINNDDPEQTILDDQRKIEFIGKTIDLPMINVPIKTK
ncbi:hypothetical protein COY88_00805 [Candidatus Roizmanbacteria bacterium CG_4_10_14_0_8_um_filter_35_28]|uniref:Uncharacterized protein n=2 Tax=Candidatus Roizmaniibacteriota TaxID=1752723 RepID=A0A2G9Y7R7_9BACT|nr:MAG: hypothetical protein COX47_00450 [Candidatus Roizmanbacteria bacterium CG23_combo_of_CG06-09_8_20_14_all_35_49]PIY71335.1 MAG: hypothetical protein COY88_00805 [Candidatus Roizmanbacteria bacterium CG_4_10_14_0_8_um_filter_35_28]